MLSPLLGLGNLEQWGHLCQFGQRVIDAPPDQRGPVGLPLTRAAGHIHPAVLPPDPQALPVAPPTR